MKQIIAAALCLFIAGSTSAQNKPAATKHAEGGGAKKAAVKKSGPCVGGIIKDTHRHMMPDVQAFIYGKDSSIVASGYTDAKGYYETNAVVPGTYLVKFVYPSNKAIIVDGVIIKNGITPINITAEEPAADTTMPFSTFAPPVDDKKAGGRKK